MKYSQAKMFNRYFWDKHANQLIAEELVAEKVLDHVDCYTYIGNVLVPLDNQRFVLIKGEGKNEGSILDAYRVVIKIDKVA